MSTLTVGNAYQTDTKGLSLGLAQWNDRGKVDISAKVWRYTGEKWSRQSEELPLHRVLDLAHPHHVAPALFPGGGLPATQRATTRPTGHRRVGLQGDA